MSLLLPVGNVAIPVKADLTTLTELIMQSQSAGVPWADALRVIDGYLALRCKESAQAALNELAQWTAEQWQDGQCRFA